MRHQRAAALIAIATLVAASSFTSFAESYRGLYIWAHNHALQGLWAGIWPLQVDVFIAVGELALFVALVDQWRTRSRAAAWAVTGVGLVVSVAGNVGHVAAHNVLSRGTAAIPPLAAAASLAVGLGVLKRVVATPRTQQEPVSATQSMSPQNYKRHLESRHPGVGPEGHDLDHVLRGHVLNHTHGKVTSTSPLNGNGHAVVKQPA